MQIFTYFFIIILLTFRIYHSSVINWMLIDIHNYDSASNFYSTCQKNSNQTILGKSDFEKFQKQISLYFKDEIL